MPSVSPPLVSTDLWLCFAFYTGEHLTSSPRRRVKFMQFPVHFDAFLFWCLLNQTRQQSEFWINTINVPDLARDTVIYEQLAWCDMAGYWIFPLRQINVLLPNEVLLIAFNQTICCKMLRQVCCWWREQFTLTIKYVRFTGDDFAGGIQNLGWQNCSRAFTLLSPCKNKEKILKTCFRTWKVCFLRQGVVPTLNVYF